MKTEYRTDAKFIDSNRCLLVNKYLLSNYCGLVGRYLVINRKDAFCPQGALTLMDCWGASLWAGKTRGEFREAGLPETVTDRETLESSENGQGLQPGGQRE